MSYIEQTKLTDVYGQLTKNTQNNELRTIEPCRTSGRVFEGNVVDTSFFTVTNTNGGTTTQTNGIVTIATNTTANGASKIVSTGLARYIGTAQMEYTSRIQFGDTGTVNNTRRWGMFNGTDGAYFKLAGTTLYIATMMGGVETAVPSASWNVSTVVPTLTNYNGWQILYTNGTIHFIINQVEVHKFTVSATAGWANTMTLPIWSDNVNSSGSTTNVTMNLRNAVNYRFGKKDTQSNYFHGTTAATTVVKYGAGTLHRLVINNAGGTLLTLYDNTAGSGSVIAVINTPSQGNPVTLTYEVEFNNGLTVVSTGTWDFTLIYQ